MFWIIGVVVPLPTDDPRRDMHATDYSDMRSCMRMASIVNPALVGWAWLGRLDIRMTIMQHKQQMINI